MARTKNKDIIIGSKKFNYLILVSALILANFLLRLMIWHNTLLFSFSDYKAYLDGVAQLVRGEKIYVLNGNFLFSISYLGFFTEKLLGSLDYFFLFNCLIGSITSLVLYFLVIKITGNKMAGIITIVIQTFYTEFMVFSSVFYSPVLMMFLLSLFILLLYFYFTGNKPIIIILSTIGLLTIFLITFFFKPELHYLPWFLVIFSLFFIRANRQFFIKILSLSFLLLTTYYLLSTSDLITHPKNNVISNAFVFFGHTDYGGDGGEGSFVYPENKIRYETAFADYCRTKSISSPGTNDYNSFQKEEMYKFITHHPLKWVNLQFTKFFRTFGVVPETSSFKVLYTGLFKGRLWLTSFVVVAPVALIIIAFILFFNFSAIKQLIGREASGFALHSRQSEEGAGCQATDNPPCEIAQSERSSLISQGQQPATSNKQPATSNQQQATSNFLSVYLLLFVYYLIASVFFGQYQERYRMPMMVVFIIPALSYFIASFSRIQFLKRSSLVIESAVIVLFLTIWTFQAKNAISNKERLNNALESVKQIKPDI